MRKQPNSRMCFVCGMENPAGLKLSFFESGPGQAQAKWVAPDNFQGYPGVVHGGIVASLLDEVAGRAVMGGAEPRFMVTVTLDVKYRKPVPLGVDLHLSGRVIKDRGRLAQVHSQLTLSDGSVAAEANVLLAHSPHSESDLCEADRLGWRVYPDGRPDD